MTFNSSHLFKKLKKKLQKFEDLHASFDYLRLRLASPEKIKKWSERILPNGLKVGEVELPETINFRTNEPEFTGLFCQVIFGPIKDWKCACGRYNGFALNRLDKICEFCWVEVTESRVRRYRMGFIQLTCPVVHYWYLKSVPNYLLLLLKAYYPDLKLSHLDQITYFREGERIISFDNPLIDFFEPKNEKERSVVKKMLLTRPEFQKVTENSAEFFRLDDLVTTKRRGPEIIKAALEEIDLETEIERSRSLAEEFSIHYSVKFSTHLVTPETTHFKRIRLLESFLSTGTNPAWMIFTILPILPPSLRPLVELETGKLATADLNEMYRLIITRNNRIFEFLYKYEAPDLISLHGRKLLQDSIDALIDNGRLPKNKMMLINEKPLKSLTETLEGKEGRFRQSLLGKRVDYSGRSVIVVNPHLRLNQCGLPYEMAVELFQPFLINEYLTKIIEPPSHNLKLARLFLRKKKPILWKLVETISTKLTILLNRAPTLHRFGIQAFDPVLVLGQAIQLHPLVCTGFNADFDGDQMAVHVPLSDISQMEAKSIMRPSSNTLSPANGDVILKPTQDMVIGAYYLTVMVSKKDVFANHWFSSEKDAIACFYQKKIDLHTPILIRYSINNFQFEIDHGELKFMSRKSSRQLFSSEFYKIKIHKSYARKHDELYILTNMGVLIAKKNSKHQFELSSFFLETTPGRLLFTLNVDSVFESINLSS